MDGELTTAMPNRTVDITGNKYGRLQVVEFAYNFKTKSYWHCVCSCGEQSISLGSQMRSGRTVSCGCSKTDFIVSLSKTHGMSKTPIHYTYMNMKARCNNPSLNNYKNYGGRGIKVKFKSFEQFYEEVGEKPTSNHTIDRIDNDGHYEPGNVRWATRSEQANNKRNNLHLTFRGRTHTVAEWSEKTGLHPKLIRARIGVNGWSVEDSLTKPSEARLK